MRKHKGSYKIILLVVIVLFSIMMRALAEDTQQKQTNPQNIDGQIKKYPPYPDVWDWQVPKGERPVADFKVKAMDNGDVMISYHQDRKDGKIVVKYVTFFEKSKVLNTATIYKGDYTDDAKSYIPFKGEYILRKIGSGTRSGGCYDALGFSITVMDKTQIKTLSSKKLLYVYDKPKFYETHPPRCMDGPSFYYRVAAVPAKFFSLKDGTFLLVAPEGYIMRFDENFKTKSQLINTKFFWLEESAWLELWKKGDYSDRADGDMNLKRLYNNLYKLLMTKKRR